MAKAAPVNPFASAAKKSAPTLKSKSPIYVAGDYFGPDGSAIFTKQDVVQAIEIFAEGHKQEESGKSMKEQARPIITQFTRNRFAKDWVLKGSRPENPKVTTNDTGDGTFCTVSFVDSAKKLDQAQFDQLAAVIGTENAEKETIRRHDFMINPDMLTDSEGTDITCKVNKGGKVIEQTVMEAITEALQDKFGPSPDVLANLFQAIEKFETRKGLIDKGIALVTTGKTPADVARLEQFVEAARVTVAIKPGSVSK